MKIIDVSYAQVAIPPGAWNGVIVQLTHDRHGIDVRGERHFADAARYPIRGGYHYANPAASDPGLQAQTFTDRALALGFRVNVNLWALDFEEHALDSGAANATWITEWMHAVGARLGSRGFLYIGWPMARACGLDAAFLRHFNWWLPAYGPNDGTEHHYDAPYAPVLHQYTSVGGPGGSGLDVSSVTDPGAFARILGSPIPKPHPKVQPVIQTSSPLRDVKAVHLPHPAGTPPRLIAVALTKDGGIFCPAPGVGFTPFTPVGQDYWKGQVAAALAVKDDPEHPLTDEEIAAGNVYAVIAESGHRYAYGPK